MADKSAVLEEVWVGRKPVEIKAAIAALRPFASRARLVWNDKAPLNSQAVGGCTVGECKRAYDALMGLNMWLVNKMIEDQKMTEEPRRVVHCWEDGPPASDGCSTTCMLEDGHVGPHIWTRDDQIGVRFLANEDTNLGQ